MLKLNEYEKDFIFSDVLGFVQISSTILLLDDDVNMTLRSYYIRIDED